jgi:stress response protein YsnF
MDGGAKIPYNFDMTLMAKDRPIYYGQYYQYKQHHYAPQQYHQTEKVRRVVTIRTERVELVSTSSRLMVGHPFIGGTWIYSIHHKL